MKSAWKGQDRFRTHTFFFSSSSFFFFFFLGGGGGGGGVQVVVKTVNAHAWYVEMKEKSYISLYQCPNKSVTTIILF